MLTHGLKNSQPERWMDTDGKMDRQMDGGVSVWTYRQSQERLTSRLTEDSKSAE